MSSILCYTIGVREVDMKPSRQLDLMKEHITVLRNQIVSLKDSQMEAVINRDHTLEELLDVQIYYLTDRLKAQLSITDFVQLNQPKKKNFFNLLKEKDDRLNAIID